MTKYQVVLLISILALIAGADENIWSTNGPYDACVTTIAVDPTDCNFLFIGTVENGMFYTTDSGENWNHVDSDVLPRTIRNIVFNPQHPDTIWAATIHSCYRSVNHGVDWELIYFSAGWHYEINALAIHPVWTNIIFVGGPFFSGINYVSYDGGQTWERLSLTLIVAENFVIDPIDDSTIYATSHTSTSRKSVYKSVDLGATWLNIHGNLDTATTIYDLAVDQVDNSVIYVCGNDWTSSDRCVYKSINGGESWTNISPEGLISDRVFSIYVSPQDHNTVFICTLANGVLRSTNGGGTWAEVNDGLTGRRIKRIEYDPVSGIYYLGTYYNGIYRSITNGSSWEKISYNIPNTNCNDYAIVPNNPAKQFVCAQNGLYATSDSGLSWEYVDILLPDYNRATTCIAIDPFNSNNIFVGVSSTYYRCHNSVVARSENGGVGWEAFAEGFPDIEWFNKIDIGHYDGRTTIFLASDHGLYKSDDYGENWYRDISIPRDLCVASDISPADNDCIYIGGYNGYGSADGGESWHELNMPVVGGFINEITCHPYNPQEVYMCIFGNGVYKSIDAGQNWVNITNNLPYESDYILFSGLAINPHNPENMFIHSFDNGVFQSHDGGGTWEAFNEGLNIHGAMATIIIDPADTNNIFMATAEQSVWSITRTPTGIDDNSHARPSQFALSAYPNPFNAAANISFSLPEASNVKLDIYDLLGRQTVSLLDSYLPAGNHSLLWHPEDLAAGVYIYRLTTHTGLSTDYYQTSKKITLLK